MVDNSTLAELAIYRTEIDPEDPAALRFYLQQPLSAKVAAEVLLGAGLNPYINLVDDQDMAIPCFGPLDIPLAKTTRTDSSPEKK